MSVGSEVVVHIRIDTSPAHAAWNQSAYLLSSLPLSMPDTRVLLRRWVPITPSSTLQLEEAHTSFVRSEAAEQLGVSEPYVFAEVDAHALPLWQQKLSRITSKTAADVVGLACQKGNVCKGTTALLLKNLTVHRNLVKMFGVRPFNDIDCVMFRTVVLLDIQCSPFPLFQQRKGRW
jgi:hypothetical protein